MHIIEINNLEKNFDEFKLQNINLSLEEGYIMGLVGSNGAGKTTLIKTIMGLYMIDKGNINVFGKDIKTHGKSVREDIGFVFDEAKFYDYKIKKLRRLIKPFYKNWDDSKFNEYIKEFNLPWNRKFNKLSKGMKLKFALAVALSHKARLLILDEPTSGLDPVFRLEFLNVMQELVEKEGVSILFSSHITDDIEKIADYITYIKDGKIEFSEDRNDLFDKWLIVKGGSSEIPEELNKHMVGGKTTGFGFEALILKDKMNEKVWDIEEKADLGKIMYYFEKAGV